MRKLLAHIFKIGEKERERARGRKEGREEERKEAGRERGRKENNLAFEGKRNKSHMYFWCTIFEMRSVNRNKEEKYKTETLEIQ